MATHRPRRRRGRCRQRATRAIQRPPIAGEAAQERFTVLDPLGRKDERFAVELRLVADADGLQLDRRRRPPPTSRATFQHRYQHRLVTGIADHEPNLSDGSAEQDTPVAQVLWIRRPTALGDASGWIAHE